MGRGIAQVCAQAGYEVTGSSRSEERATKTVETIDAAMARSVERGRMSQEDKDAAVSRIKGTADVKDFSDCDLVIEVAVEELEVKKQVEKSQSLTARHIRISIKNSSPPIQKSIPK